MAGQFCARADLLFLPKFCGPKMGGVLKPDEHAQSSRFKRWTFIGVPCSSFLRAAAFGGACAVVAWVLGAAAQLSSPLQAAAGEAERVFIVDWPAPILDKSPKERPDLGSLDVLGREEGTERLIVRALPAQMGGLMRASSVWDAEDIVSRWETAGGLEGYLNPDGVQARLEQLAAEYPDLVRLEGFGTSHEGRPLVAAVVQRGSGESRPTVFFNGMHHAREVMTTEVVMSILEELVSEASHDPEIGRWLQRYRIVIVPQVNPDGNERVHMGQRFWRKNAWPEAESARVTGVDLNRNYPALWGACNGSSGQRSSDTYRGPAPASEPETRAVMDLVGKYRPILAISYHAFSELIVFPYGCRGQQNQARGLFEEVAAQINAGVVNDRGLSARYGVGTAPELLYNADGSDLDWQWDVYGVLAFTLEINSSSQGFQPEYSRWRDKTIANQQGGWKAVIRRLDGPALLARVLVPDAGLWQSRDSAWGDTLYYSIEVAGPSPVPFALDAYGMNKRFPLRDRTGLIHHPLKPGAYELVVGRGDEVLRRMPVLVSQEVASERVPVVIDLRSLN
jgi:hypothetical protein